MPAPTTVSDFLQVVRKSALVAEKPLNAFVEQLQDLKAPSSGEDGNQVGKVASIMVAKGLLSFFQAEKLLEGKWRGFTIGPYRVLERLGKGGLGNVYLCAHQFTQQRMAVKVLRGANVDDPIAVKRFYREAQAAAALKHPNIVRAYDVGQSEKLHYLVMDYVDGASLQEIVTRRGPLDILRACHYVRQAADGLQHAHEAGLVHRDIKPSNLLLDRQGTLKILDLGLARVSHDETEVLTRGNDVLGSADYLAPEQAMDSHGVDIRADIYGLGGVFYYLLTGAAPFGEAKTIAQKLIAKQRRQPQPIRVLCPDVPPLLANIIDKMLATSPEDRDATPAQVAAALAPFVKRPIAPPPESEMPKPSPAVLASIEAQTPARAMPKALAVAQPKAIPVGGGTSTVPALSPRRPAAELPAAPPPPEIAAPPRRAPVSGSSVPEPARSAKPDSPPRPPAVPDPQPVGVSVMSEDATAPRPRTKLRKAVLPKSTRDDRLGLGALLILVLVGLAIVASFWVLWNAASRVPQSMRPMDSVPVCQASAATTADPSSTHVELESNS
jgi:serine/threonine protein kinase